MVEQIKPFAIKDYTPAGPYDLEFSGRPLRAVSLRFAATLAAGIPVTVRDDAAFRLLKTPEINQSENPLVRMEGESWRHISAFVAGSYDMHAAGTSVATTGQVLAMATLDFERLMPGSLINAADKKVFLRGEFGALASYAATPPTTITGKLRPYGKSSEIDPNNGFLRPKFTEGKQQIVNADDQQYVVKFEQDTVVQGLFVRQNQASAAGAPRVDGLVKAIRIDVTAREGNIEVHRFTWGQLRASFQSQAGYNPEDYARSIGCAFIPIQTRANGSYNKASLFKAGDSLTLHTDCTGTAEDEFASVTAATGDTLTITVLGYTPVSAAGDTAAQVRSIDRSPVDDAQPKGFRARRAANGAN